MFSPEFIGQRAEITSHDYAAHLVCSCMCITFNKAFWFPKEHIVGFVADVKGTLNPPKGAVPFGKDLVRTLDFIVWLITTSLRVEVKGTG